MKRIVILAALCLIASLALSQTVLYTAGTTYVKDGPPAHDPGSRGSKIVVDTTTWMEYGHLSGSTGRILGF